jgi:hypothetical protein
MVTVASSLNAKNGYVMTSLLNTNDHEIVMPEPKLKLARIENIPTGKEGLTKRNKYQANEVLNKLRYKHLNSREREILENTCLDYQDIFHLPEDKLSSTKATRHSITLVPGTTPINTRPYRLPKVQKVEMERQVDKLLDEGITEESNSLWNSPLLVVPKKKATSGERKWQIVVDFRKLNEKTTDNAYPLPDITEIGVLDQLGQSKYFSRIDMVMGYHQIELNPDDRNIKQPSVPNKDIELIRKCHLD